MNSLKNKNIIVTGASGGIGNSIVEKLSQNGANILATCTRMEKLEELKEKFNNIRILKFDISQHDKIEDLDKIMFDLKASNIKNIKLPVSAPFHCKLMNKATLVMKEEIAKLDFNKPKNILISNVTGKEISNSNELKELLISQIESSVRWRESVLLMIEKGVTEFIEIGPGKVLSGLIKRIDRNVKVSAINSEEDIKLININE